MPEMRFRVRWPDDSETDCYSPSTAIKDFISPGETYDLKEFLDRSRRGLSAASERVFRKYGFHCSSASDQLAEIERIAAKQPGGLEAKVAVLSFIE